MQRSIRTILMEKHAEKHQEAAHAPTALWQDHLLSEANGFILSLWALRDAGVNVDAALAEEENPLT